MKYFKDAVGGVHGFDENDLTQTHLIEMAISNKWEDITGNWPLRPSQQDIVNIFKSKLSAVINQAAIDMGYDSIISAISYLHSSNVQFSADAKLLLDWRDTVWEWAFTQFSTITSDSIEEILTQVPQAPMQIKG